MALRDPAAAKGVQVVAHIYGRRVDAEVKRIDWAKTDARATSEKARENVIIKFDWDDGKTTKNYSESIAEESLTLSDGLPFRTKDYEHALLAAREAHGVAAEAVGEGVPLTPGLPRPRRPSCARMFHMSISSAPPLVSGRTGLRAM